MPETAKREPVLIRVALRFGASLVQRGHNFDVMFGDRYLCSAVKCHSRWHRVQHDRNVGEFATIEEAVRFVNEAPAPSSMAPSSMRRGPHVDGLVEPCPITNRDAVRLTGHALGVLLTTLVEALSFQDTYAAKFKDGSEPKLRADELRAIVDRFRHADQVNIIPKREDQSGPADAPVVQPTCLAAAEQLGCLGESDAPAPAFVRPAHGGYPSPNQDALATDEAAPVVRTGQGSHVADVHAVDLLA